MIIGDPTTYRCDLPSCEKTEAGFTYQPPKGWVTTRWVPGLLSKAGAPPPPPDRHYCCREHRSADHNARQKVQEEMHADPVHESVLHWIKTGKAL